MKTFLLTILPKIYQYSKKLDDTALLTNQHWVLMGSIGAEKTIYIFRANNELLISTNGIVTKGNWDYMGNNTILVDMSDKSYLFKLGFFDNNVLALKHNNNEYAIFVNENQFDGELNSIEKLEEFLKNKYLINKDNQIMLDSNKENLNPVGLKGNREFLFHFLEVTKYFLIIGFVILLVAYIVAKQEVIRYNIFNDKSVVFRPNFMFADPIGDLIAFSIIFIGGLIFIIYFQKSLKK